MFSIKSIEYSIPQLWNPEGDNYLSDLDFVEGCKNAGYYFRSQPADIAALGIASGIPDYRINALIWCLLNRDKIPTGQWDQVLLQKMEEYRADHRRILHQYFFRDAPWGETQIWSPEDASRFETKNWIGKQTDELRANSKAKYRDFIYTTDKNGQPILTASYSAGMNYADPVVYEIDYVQMCMLTKYRTAYESGQKYNPEIFWTNFAWEAVSTTISMLAGYAGAALRQAWKPMAMYEAPTLGKFAVDFVEELFWENAVSAFLQFGGVSEGVAEQIAEIVGMDVVLGRIFKSKSSHAKSAETQKNIQMLNEFLLGTESLAQAKAAGVAHKVAEGRPAVSLWQRIRAQVTARQAASILDQGMITTLHQKLSTDEVQQTRGTSRNIAGHLDAVRSVLNLAVTKFARLQKEYRQFLKTTLMTALLEGGSKATIFQEIYNDPDLKILLGLGDPKTGNKFQFFEFVKRKGKGTPSEQLVLNPRGLGGAEVKQNGRVVQTMTETELSEFLEQDLGEFLSEYHLTKCEDPQGSTLIYKPLQWTELQKKNENVEKIKNHYETLFKKGKLTSHYDDFNVPGLSVKEFQKRQQGKHITSVAYAKISQLKQIIDIVKRHMSEAEFFKLYGDIISKIPGLEDCLVAIKGNNKNLDGTAPFVINEMNILKKLMEGNNLIDEFKFSYPKFEAKVNRRWSDAETKLFILLYKLVSQNIKWLKDAGITQLDINLFSEREICPSCWAIINQFVEKCSRSVKEGGLGININLKFDFAGPLKYAYKDYVSAGYPPTWK